MFPLLVLALSFSAESVKLEILSCAVSSLFALSDIYEYRLKPTDKNDPDYQHLPYGFSYP